MKKIILLLLSINLSVTVTAQTLSHNVGDNIFQTSLYTCSGGGNRYARTFTLADFGVSPNEDFIINSGDIGFSEVGVWDVYFNFNIYVIDSDFPASFDNNSLIGSSQLKRIYQSDGNSIVTIEFDTPIIVPAGVERILVEAAQKGSTSSAVTFIAGTHQDNDYSWLRYSCFGPEFVTSEDLNRPDARIYVTVEGEQVLGQDNYESEKIALYPNPTSGFLTLSKINGLDIEKVMLYDISGKAHEITIEGNTINVSDYQKGIYFLNINTVNTSKTFKVVKL